MTKYTMTIKDYKALEIILREARKLGGYHICEEAEYVSELGEIVVTSWTVFLREGLTLEEYFDSSNAPIISSRKGNDINDLILFIEEVKERRKLNANNKTIKARVCRFKRLFKTSKRSND